MQRGVPFEGRMLRVDYERLHPPRRLRLLFRKLLHIVARNMPWPGPRVFLFRVMGVRVGRHVRIGLDGFFDDQFAELTIFDEGAIIGHRVLIVVHDDTQGGAIGPGELFRAQERGARPRTGHVGIVRVGRQAIVGARSTLLPGIEIGARAVVLPGSVVTRDVPPGAIVQGSPARILRQGH
jgi:acetyltransferase-like isoleucine patch superfamily enzyme